MTSRQKKIYMAVLNRYFNLHMIFTLLAKWIIVLYKENINISCGFCS